MEKLTDTCYLDENKKLSVVQPQKMSDWIVINKQGALMYGPDNKANCFRFVEGFEV